MAAGKRNTIVLNRKINSNLPEYRVLETDDETYMICLEAANSFKCFGTLDAPDIKTANRKRLKILDDRPLTGDGEEWDTGTYNVAGQGNKLAIIKALLSSLTDRVSFTLDLNGEKLKGSYSMEWDRKLKTWYLKKANDTEEDVAGPDEDVSETKTSNIADEEDAREGKASEPEEEDIAEAGDSDLTAGYISKPSSVGKLSTSFSADINGLTFHFTFYKAIDPLSTDTVCMVSLRDEINFAMLSKGNKWQIITSVPMNIARLESRFADAIDAYLRP